MTTVNRTTTVAALLAAAGLVLAFTRCGGDSPAVPGQPSAPAPSGTPTPTVAATPAPTVAPAPTPTATPTPEPPPPVILNELSPGISVTPDNQLVVEVQPEDATAANLFDLAGRSLVFTPDGDGGYSRSVRPLAWEDDIGRRVEDDAKVEFPGFRFDFAGRSWGSFFVSRHGLVTFGEELKYQFSDAFLKEIAARFVSTPTISALYKPRLGGNWPGDGRQYVATAPDRVVVTWTPTEPRYHVHGLPPTEPSRFQLVLGSNGEIRFNYDRIAWQDGIVGLFPLMDVTRGDLIASVADERNPGLPGHLDILDVSIYESNTDAVIVEFTLRDDVQDPPDGELFAYRLRFDTDEPYWSHPVDWSDEDMTWTVDFKSNGRRTTNPTTGSMRLLQSGADNRIVVLASLPPDSPGIRAMFWATVAHWGDDGYVQGDNSRLEFLELAGSRVVDLSRQEPRSAAEQSEVFHYRSLRPDSIVCRVINLLGDEFDLFIYHSESRVDAQSSGTGWRSTRNRNNIEGIGSKMYNDFPCESSRLKGRWEKAIWIKSHQVLDGHRFNTSLFAHEVSHTWTAYASYMRNGVPEPLFDELGHWWRRDAANVHLPVAFPRHGSEFEGGTLMGGTYWRENSDGTFTPSQIDRVVHRHSWLDLYLMGLAEAHEVPDMFILRNLRRVNARQPHGPYTADKEVVTIEQIIAAEGSRVPSATNAQKDFNTAFLYLVEPGQTPDAAMLRLHRDWLDTNVTSWSDSTGGRSRITTRLPGIANHPR